MKVWIVMGCNPSYDGGDTVESIHASKAGAEKVAARWSKAAERCRDERGRLLNDDEAYAREPWPEWPKDVPESETIQALGPWTVRA